MNRRPWTSKEASQEKFRPSSSSLVVSKSQAGSPGAGRSGTPWSQRVGLDDVNTCPVQVTLMSVPTNGYNSSISRIGGGKPIWKGKGEANIFLKLAATPVLLLLASPGWAGTRGKTMDTITASVRNGSSNKVVWEFESFSYNKCSMPSLGCFCSKDSKMSFHLIDFFLSSNNCF